MDKGKVIQAAKEIKASYKTDVIKDIEFPQLVNFNTGKETGIGVIFQVSTKYDYDMGVVEGWKKKLGADDWKIKYNRNRLEITYYIHFKVRKRRNYEEDNVQ